MMLFSICIPITKINYLKKSIDSVLNQSYSNYEVILQNNASTDQEKSEIRKVCNNYLELSQFSYYENETQLSISDNFNLILNRTSGLYIAILSDDDLIAPDFLLQFHKLINLYPKTYLFHCRVRLINETEKVISYSPSCPEFENLTDFLFNRLLGFRMQFLSDFVFLKTKLIDVGGFKNMPSGWGLDDVTWYSLAENGVAFTNFIGLDYRVSTVNISYKKMNKENNILKLLDIKFLFSEIEKIVNSPQFEIESSYSKEIFKSVIQKSKEMTNIQLFKIICRNCGMITSTIFFLQNQKKFQLPGKTIFYIIGAKFFKGQTN